ncbi:DedA family protein [Streptomyces sp. NPDC050433]|uniref:DedA family protein n=1 Tax=Streptomyces sp. NPDC050433 TaxID=3365615 RepID=UPI0037B7A9D8
MIGTSAQQWVDTLMDTLGAPGAGIATALENLFPPLPSEVILPLAGFAVSTGRMNLIAALLWTTAGSVVGALALYGLGAWLGRERTISLVSKVPLVKASDVEKTEEWFNRHGMKAVFFGRMIPVFRSLISVPAGIERMPLPVFLCLTTLGSAIWNTAFIMAGYALGENWEKVSGYVSTYSKFVVGFVLLALVAFVVRRVVKSRREKQRG